MRTAGITAAIKQILEDHSQRSLGERIDVARSTLGEWGAEPSSWPADKLLALAAEFPSVREAILEAWAGREERGRAADASRDAFGVMVTGNKTMAGLATDLADGTLSPAEARARLPELREHHRQVHRLILDAEAVAAAGGVIGGAR